MTSQTKHFHVEILRLYILTSSSIPEEIGQSSEIGLGVGGLPIFEVRHQASAIRSKYAIICCSKMYWQSKFVERGL